MSDGERTYRLRMPARFVVRFLPAYLVVMGVVFGGATSVMLVSAATDDETSAGSLALVVLFFVVYWTLIILVLRPSLSLVREVRQGPDGVLEMTTALGRTHVLDDGDVVEVREQMIIPQPGTVRVRTEDGGRFYLWTFEDKFELVDQVRRLQREA